MADSLLYILTKMCPKVFHIFEAKFLYRILQLQEAYTAHPA